MEAVSLRRVAALSETSLGAITYYFENRRGLLEACLDANYNWFQAEVETSLASIAAGEPWESVIGPFVRKLFRITREYRELVRLRLLTTMQHGALPEGRLERVLMPTLNLVAGALGDPEAGSRLRLAAHSLHLIVVRYGLHTDAECVRITGAESTDEAVQRIEEHLVRLCVDAFSAAIPR